MVRKIGREARKPEIFLLPKNLPVFPRVTHSFQDIEIHQSTLPRNARFIGTRFASQNRYIT